MKKSFIFISAALLLIAGCGKEQPVEPVTQPDGHKTIVRASFEKFGGNDDTKATLVIGDDNAQYKWKDGEDAAFFDEKGDLVKGIGTGDASFYSFDLSNKKLSASGGPSGRAFYPYGDETNHDFEYNLESHMFTKARLHSSRGWVADEVISPMAGNGVYDQEWYNYKYQLEGEGEHAWYYNFSHLCGVVKVRIVNAPASADRFVFKTPGYRINGMFDITQESNYDVIKAVKGTTESQVPDGDDTYTLTIPSPGEFSANINFDFYIPLPVGKYDGFSIYLYDDNTVLAKVEGTTDQEVKRATLLVMPTITLTGGNIEQDPAATVQQIPIGYNGDFLLADSDNILLNICSESATNKINLKYGKNKEPKKLEIRVVDGGNGNSTFAGTLSGNLPKTHVDFTQGEIANVEMTTSSSTLEIVYPAKITTKLTVNGGNVTVKGATIAAIEVAVGAVADAETNVPVQIAVENYTPEGGTQQTPEITGGITANEDIVVAPDAGVTVEVSAGQDVQVAKAGEGDVTGVIPTKTKAKIGDVNYFTLADAVKAAPKNATSATTITLLDDVADGAGIFLDKTDKKNIIIDLNGKTYTAKEPAVGSNGYKTQAFHLEEDNTVVIKNGTLDVATDAEEHMKMLIQNYCNLTLTGVKVDGTNLKASNSQYVFSNNCGTVVLDGNTSIIAPANFKAFDVCKYGDYAAPKVTWASTGTVTGEIELSGGEFVVAKDLALTQPIKAKDAAAKLTVNANITPSTNNWTTIGTKDALVVVNRGGNLTISGTGTITNNNNTGVMCAVKMTEKDEAANASTDADRAKLTVEGNVTLIGYNYGISGNGNRQDTDITINGGTIKGVAANDCVGIYHPQRGNLTINGGTIEGATGIYVKSGSVTTSINAGTIKGVGAKGDYVTAGKFTNTGDAFALENCDYPGGEPNAAINGGTFTSANGLAVASYAKAGKTPISPVINGGKFSDLSGLKYVANNAVYTLCADVTNAAGITLDTKKTFTLDFGGYTYTVNKPGAGSTNTQTQAFQLLAGQTITFRDGTIMVANTNLSADESDGKKPIKRLIQNYANLTLTNMELNGANLNGKNSVVEFCNGTVLVDGTTNFYAKKDVASINVDSWKGSYPNGTAVTINTTGNVGKIHCYTEGSGSMTTKSSLTVENGKNISIDDVSGGEVNITINGGEFTDMKGVNYVAQDKIYTLANDVNLGESILEINSGKKFTVDLNKKTLTGRTNITHGNVTFGNGEIYGLTGNVDAKYKQPLNVYGSAESSVENYSVVTIAIDAKVEAEVYGVCVFGATAGTTGYGAVANIAGAIRTTGDGNNGAVFVSGNLGVNSDGEFAVSNKNAVNIYYSANIFSSTDAAIALNGSATVTVGDNIGNGPTLTGATAIAAKRGKLIVNSGKIEAKGACNGNPAPNRNGTEMTGSAVSATATYKDEGPLSVEIKGGTFTSNAYTILNNHDECTFDISGGSFKTALSNGIAVYARLGSVNITGGTFENKSNSEATLHVGCPTAVTASLQPKLTISGANTAVRNAATGNYAYDGGKPLVVNMANELSYKAVEISGGRFYYRDPSRDDNVQSDNGNFLKSGYTVSGDETNGWTVTSNN